MSGETSWTVSTLAQAIRRHLEGEFGTVQVEGELGRVTRHSSGHMYFDLKDEDSVLHAAWFKGAQRKMAFALEQGLAVRATGRLTTYPARSEYQLIVTNVELAGVGALLKLIEDRKQKLAAEGLFDASRKKALPLLPVRVGIITSPTGAVIQDILHRLRDRYMPQVLLWPVSVQGDTAADEVRQAVEGFQTLSPAPDVIIIARGGGSVEDLMPFNDEALVRAVAASRIPIISAIGHETDWTLIDLAADMRAPTPTGAAEFAVPVKADLEATLESLSNRLKLALHHRFEGQRAELRALGRALPNPHHRLEVLMQKLDERSLKLTHGLGAWLHRQQLSLSQRRLRHPRELLALQQQRLSAIGDRLSAEMLQQRHLVPATQRLASTAQMLELLSYQRTLERGYAVVLDDAGKAITSVKTAPDSLRLRLKDGELQVQKKL